MKVSGQADQASNRVHFSIVDMYGLVQLEKTKACNGDWLLMGPCFYWSKYGMYMCIYQQVPSPLAESEQLPPSGAH